MTQFTDFAAKNTAENEFLSKEFIFVDKAGNEVWAYQHKLSGERKLSIRFINKIDPSAITIPLLRLKICCDEARKENICDHKDNISVINNKFYEFTNTLDFTPYVTNDVLIFTSEFGFEDEHFKSSIILEQSPPIENLRSIVDPQLFKHFDLLFSNKNFADFKFIVKDRELMVHKAILAAHSPVFAAMFSSEMQEKQSNFATIKDFSFEAFQELLRFCYSGLAPNVDAVRFELVDLAAQYQLDDLLEKCFESLQENVTVEDACEILVLAHNHLREKFKQTMIQFIKENKNAVVNTEGFKHLTGKLDLMKEVVIAI